MCVWVLRNKLVKKAVLREEKRNFTSTMENGVRFGVTFGGIVEAEGEDDSTLWGKRDLSFWTKRSK